VKVVDGALRNALVCIDANDNGACDAGEPQARTDTGGNATLDVPNALVGAHAVVAMVGTDAVDADFGPVTVPFVLTAPKDRTALVSPLTTLVESRMRATGTDMATAEAVVRERAALQVSPFADYTAAASGDAVNTSTRAIARLVVLTTQAQTAALTAAVGSTDLSGATITQADVNRAAMSAVLGVLPVLGTAVTDPSISGAADRDAALNGFATTVALAQTGLTAASAPATIGLQKLYAQAPTALADDTSGTAALRALRYTDATSWFYRAIVQSPADTPPDAQGRVRYYDLRRAPVSGVVQTWGLGSSYARRGDLFWNGSAWTDCPFGTRGTTTVRDAAGRTNYVFCGGYSSGTSQLTQTSIEGRTLASVIQQIRTLPGGDSGVSYAAWGPSDLGALGDAVFPSGATLGFQRNIETAYAPAYDPTVAPVAVVNADIAAGGDATGGNSPACGAIGATTPFASYSSTATSLDAVIAANRGTPCLFRPGTDPEGSSSGPRNEWWSQSTVNIGTVVPTEDIRPTGTGTFYRQTRDLRFAFTGEGQVTYYNCLIRSSGGTGRNCDVAGTGSYTIQTLGDARVLTITTPPASTAPLTYERVLIERGGVVSSGFRVKPTTSDTARLNLVAANTVLGQLGLPLIAP
jgi:hypothetical protein